jgi:osmotically-inducible protein OsmY
MDTDRALQDLVMTELEWEPSVDAAHIGVAARNGVVTLSGHVSSFIEKRAAEEAAARVAGVKAVAVEIEIRLPTDKKRADDEIARRALDIIAWDATIPDNRVKVKVERGVITLDGTVDWQFQKAAADRAVHKLTGVTGVINRIAVEPQVSAADLRSKIESAFRRNAEFDADGITVTTEGGKVTLTGRVRSWYERQMAENAAWSAPGVVQVEDHITII